MCKCDKSRKVFGHVVHLAQKFEEITGEETVVVEDEPDEFVFETKRIPLDKSKYTITREEGRIVYSLKK